MSEFEKALELSGKKLFINGVYKGVIKWLIYIKN